MFNINVIDKNQDVFSLKATPKNDEEIRILLQDVPHNLTMFETGFSHMFLVENKDNKIIMRSKERLRIVELKEQYNQQQFLFITEEYDYLLAICSILNDFEINYELDNNIADFIKELCLTTNEENLNERMEYQSA